MVFLRVSRSPIVAGDGTRVGCSRALAGSPPVIAFISVRARRLRRRFRLLRGHPRADAREHQRGAQTADDCRSHTGFL